MKRINTITQAALGELQTGSTKSRDRTLQTEEAFPKAWVSALFKKFQSRYGHKWTSTIDGIEDIAVSEWAAGLTGITGEQIKRGLDTWNGDWPPSLNEFKKACAGNGKNDFGLDYVPEYYRKETRPERILESDPDKARRKKAARAGVAAMREAMKLNNEETA